MDLTNIYMPSAEEVLMNRRLTEYKSLGHDISKYERRLEYLFWAEDASEIEHMRLYDRWKPDAEDIQTELDLLINVKLPKLEQKMDLFEKSFPDLVENKRQKRWWRQKGNECLQ